MTKDDALATWLEELDLAGALAEAGLPTFTRDADGHAVWSDPDRVEELDRALRSQGEDPAHAVPVALVVIARQARLREELLATLWHTYATLGEVRGTSLDATRFAVHKAASEHRLLVVPHDERAIVPAFQLDAAGELRAELAPVLAPLLTARMDPWRAWAWLTQPAALTLGQAPEQAAVADPDLARVAAERLAERL